MAYYIASDDELQSVANAIRAKGKTDEGLVFPSGFISSIGELEHLSAWYPEAINSSGVSISGDSGTKSASKTFTLDRNYLYELCASTIRASTTSGGFAHTIFVYGTSNTGEKKWNILSTSLNSSGIISATMYGDVLTYYVTRAQTTHYTFGILYKWFKVR